MTYDIGFVLDGLILIFLSVTIFYAARLSLFMKAFREGRDGIQLLIRDLSVTIDKAEQSIQIMKEHAQLSEQELREIVNEAKFLSDELRFMNETGDGLAERLEKLADRNRELVDLMERSGGIGTQRLEPFEPSKKPIATAPKKKSVEIKVQDDPFEISDFDIDEDDETDFMALENGIYEEDEADHKSKVNTESKSKVRSFAIFDRDYSEIGEDMAEDEPPSEFHSRAEQDLYEAIQRKKRVNEVT